jgi:hypothetical protein
MLNQDWFIIGVYMNRNKIGNSKRGLTPIKMEKSKPYRKYINSQGIVIDNAAV